MKKVELPKIGQRIIKSAAAVLLCYLIYLLRNRAGIPFYSMLGALWCIQPYTGKTRQMALQRTTGTLVGAAYGLIAILLEIYVFHIYDRYEGFLLNTLLIIPVLYTTVLLHKQNASYFSCVVYLSIVVNHMTDANPYIFVGNRVLDTFLGIAVGIGINSMRLPRRKIKDCLFIGKLDDMLAPVKEELSAYSVIEINRMLDDGMQFTVATMRTPASLMKPLDGVKLELPVIAMDGAALYHLKENTYMKAYVISHDSCNKMVRLIRTEGMNCFVNALYDDTLVIYYDKLENEAEQDIYKKLKRSPFRNYVHREPTEGDRTIYIMMVDKTSKIEGFYQKLSECGYTKNFKILHYKSDDYAGFSYIKIYNKNANAENMVRYLMESRQLSKTRVIGADRDTGSNFDGIVRKLKESFEPVIFK